jgi:hypothetical protein
MILSDCLTSTFICLGYQNSELSEVPGETFLAGHPELF